MTERPRPGMPGGSRALSWPLPETIRVVNVELALFGDAVRAQYAEAVDVRWQIRLNGSAWWGAPGS